MNTSEKVLLNEDMMAYTENSFCKNDILDVLKRELEVCKRYNILSLKIGLEIAVRLIETLPIEFKSAVVQPMVLSLLKDQLKTNKSYQMYDSVQGLEHAHGMVRVMGNLEL